MMTKLRHTLLLISFLNFNSPFYAQSYVYDEGEISIEFITGKKISLLNESSSTKLKSKELTKIKVVCKIRSLHKGKIDINKFSLIDRENKLRYRPTDISYIKIVDYLPYGKLTKKDVHVTNIHYNSRIIDTFKDYNFPEHIDIEIPTNFGSLKKPNQSIVYFWPIPKKNQKVSLFFALIDKAEQADYELYYGLEKVSDVHIENYN